MKIKELEIICQTVLDDNPKQVKAYKKGNKGLIGFLTGKVMILSDKEFVNPTDIITILKEKLK